MVAFGQLLRAGHHSTYTIYDRPDHASPWGPAITLTGDRVVSAGEASSAAEKDNNVAITRDDDENEIYAVSRIRNSSDTPAQGRPQKGIF